MSRLLCLLLLALTSRSAPQASQAVEKVAAKTEDYVYEQGNETPGDQYATTPSYAASGYAPPTTYPQSCSCKASSPCYNPITRQCVRTLCPDGKYVGGYGQTSYGQTSTPYTGDTGTAEAAGRQLDAPSYSIDVIPGYEYGEETVHLHRHFACSTCYCPNGSFRCTGWNQVTNMGRIIFWVGFGILIAACGFFFFRGVLQEPINQTFPFLSAAMCFIAALTYLVMATGHGFSGGCPGSRHVYYVRYVEWVLTSPIMLMMLSFANGIPNETRCFIIFLDIIMIFAGLIGAFVTTKVKWAFFAFALLCMLPIFWVLCANYSLAYKYFRGRADGAELSSRRIALHLLLGSWTLYPVVWAISEGADVISATTEAGLFMALDIVSKVGFSAVLVHGYQGGIPTQPQLEQQGLVPSFSSLL